MTGHTDSKMQMKHAQKYSSENTIKRSKGRWKDPLFRLVRKKKSFDKSRDFQSLVTLTLKSICNIQLSPS
jgi:IS1 family transposase